MDADIKVQPVFLALIHIVAALVLRWLIPLPFLVPSVLASLGFLLVILGFFFGVAALMAFRIGRTTASPRGVPARLVTSGIYRFTRNPIYFGFLLMLVGIPLNAGSFWGILLAPLMVIFFNRLVIKKEEETLANRFGEAYQIYLAKVRRWI
jgi:protein-S-isoprenylcysteine O-methyltransferase Ste14